MAWARGQIDDGRRRAGRSEPHPLVALCVTGISERDPDGIRRELAAWAGPLLLAMVGTPLVGASEVGPELARLVWSRGGEATTADLPDTFLDEFVAAGDPSRCRTMVDRLLDAGADRVILVTNPAGIRSTLSMVEQLRPQDSVLWITKDAPHLVVKTEGPLGPPGITRGVVEMLEVPGGAPPTDARAP